VALSVPEAYNSGREVLLRPSPLASTLPCGVRTFLSSDPKTSKEASEAEQRSPGLLAQGYDSKAGRVRTENYE
jgi:hypothetical protein